MSSHRIASLTVAAAAAALLSFAGPGIASATGADTGGAVWPLTPRPEVVTGFDPPAQNWDPGHRGVDLRGAPGQTVRATKAGRISYAGLLAGRGVVVVDHGDTRTTYQPVASSVHVGDQVTTAQKIGVLKTFGSHCWPGTCLHWGLLRGETYLNPLTLVGAGPVRLLPLFANLGRLEAGPLRPLFVNLGLLGATPAAQPARTPWVRPLRPVDVLAGRPAAVDPW